jgi:hypothetical protein
MQCQCDGLDEQTCLADQSLGCTANYCSFCGGSSFSGCTGPGEPAPVCAEKCPAQLVCHGNSDCAGGDECVAPGGSVCGGICGTSCSADSDCTTGQVCDYDCNCGTTGKACIAACSSTSCATGETCGADGHCAADACASPADCPAYFDCVFPSDSTTPYCQRRACSADSDCGTGAFCVDGGCYGALGTCQAPPA